MKAFLDAWLLEAPMGFSQELAGMVKLMPSEATLGVAETLSCRVEIGEAFNGAFWITADAEAIGQLLIAARITAGNPDRNRDAQLWQDIVRQVAERSTKFAGKAIGRAVSVISVHEAQHPGLDSFVSYELRFGGISVRIAFADQTKLSATEGSKARVQEAPPVRGIDLLLDVELDASLRFGSKEMLLGEVLELGPGDVVQLERHVTDPVDLVVGDKIVARGEVVLINGNFGLRVTEVAEPRKCLESIRCLF